MCPFDFEIWASICLFTYDELAAGAVDEGDLLVISLEKLLFMKALALQKEKYLKDTQLIAQRILRSKYEQYDSARARADALLSGVRGIVYLEKTGPAS